MPDEPALTTRSGRRVVKRLLIAGGALLALVALVTAIGSALPIRHTAALESVFPAPRNSLYALITDVARYPEWRAGVERVELHPAAGRLRWAETGADGKILYEAVESVPGIRLVTRIADPGLPFGGSWTFELEDTPAGTRLRITEDGEVYNPVFRFLSRFVFGHDRTIERFLADLRTAIGS